MQWTRLLSRRWIKIPVFALCLVPVLLLAWKAFHQGLGANPIEFITHATGDWTLRFLAITLAVSPLRRLLGLPDLIRFRRMLGLFAFFYGCLHFTTYLWLDKFFDFHEIVKDVWKRPFITVGFLGFIVHYYWLVKSDVRKPLLYGGIVLVLLSERVVVAIRKSGVNLKAWILKKPGGGNTASVSKPRASSSVR